MGLTGLWHGRAGHLSPGAYITALLFQLKKLDSKNIKQTMEATATCIRITNRYDRLGLLPS